jgi:hypothetical protein
MSTFRVSQIALAIASCVGAAPPLPSPASVLAAMGAADDYFIAHNPAADCGWTRGTYFAGESAHFNVSGNLSLTAFSTSWAESHNWTCGGKKHYRVVFSGPSSVSLCGGGKRFPAPLPSLGPDPSSLDPNNYACGMTYSALYELDPANYKLALLVTLQQAIANSPPYSWWWVSAAASSHNTRLSPVLSPSPPAP